MSVWISSFHEDSLKKIVAELKNLNAGGMSFLPIVARELRVATRKRATYWNGSLAVLLAAAVTIYILTTLGRMAGWTR